MGIFYRFCHHQNKSASAVPLFDAVWRAKSNDSQRLVNQTRIHWPVNSLAHRTQNKNHMSVVSKMRGNRSYKLISLMDFVADVDLNHRDQCVMIAVVGATPTDRNS